MLCATVIAQGETTSFEEARVISPGSYRVLRRGQDLLGVEFDPALLGGEGTWTPFAFGHPVRRVRVYAVQPGHVLLILAGGVRSDLSVHVLRRDGMRRSLHFPAGRLVRRFELPRIDTRGEICGVLFEREGRILLLVHDLRPWQPRVLFARELEKPPERFRLEALPGSAHIAVRLGPVRTRAPGELALSGPQAAEGFLHPSARIPEPSRLHLDFGSFEFGGGAVRELTLRNPGALPLQVVWDPPRLARWSLSVTPVALQLGPGEEAKVRVELRTTPAEAGPQRGPDTAPPPDAEREAELALETRLPLHDSSRQGDPLLSLRVTATATRRVDREPPVFDPSRIELRLLDAQLIEVLGRAGAVTDATGPIEVIGVRGDRTHAAPDGSFRILVPRGVEGRVVLVARDGLGQSARPVFVGRVRDEAPPEVDVQKLRLGPVAGDGLWFEALPGALRDLTPPLRLELAQGGQRRELAVRPAADGSFRTRVEARPGEELELFVHDAAVPRNVARVPLGRAVPFVTREGAELVVHGLPWARVRLASFTGEPGGAAPVPLVELAGRLDGAGRLALPVERLREGVQLVLAMEDPASGRFGAVLLPMP